MQWKSPQLNEPFHLTMLVSPSIGPIKMTQTPVETQIIRIQYGNMLNHLWSVEGSCERGRYCWNRRRGLQSPVAIRRTFPHTRQHTLDFDFVIDLIYLKKGEESNQHGLVYNIDSICKWPGMINLNACCWIGLRLIHLLTSQSNLPSLMKRREECGLSHHFRFTSYPRTLRPVDAWITCLSWPVQFPLLWILLGGVFSPL